MLVSEMNQILDRNANSSLHVMLPSGEFVPAHFHVTEVGRVQKTFIDCGGTRREGVSCMLQVWTAQDFEHRLVAGKLSKIMKLAEPVLAAVNLAVEVEYGSEVASQYLVASIEKTPNGLLFVLAGKRTACLAPDKCGMSSCRSTGCC